MKGHRLRDATPPALLIAAHCLTITRKSKRFEPKEFSAILDDIVRELDSKTLRRRTYLHSLNEVLHTLNTTSPLVLFGLGSHDFFLLVRDITDDLLQQLQTSYLLNEQELLALRNCILLLENLVERSANPSKLIHWITEMSFLQTFAGCLDGVERILKVDVNQRFIKQIAHLLGVFSDLQERLPIAFHQDSFQPLFEPIVNCLTSPTYTASFRNLKGSNHSLTSKEKFFLIKCPHFLTGYNGTHPKKSIESLLGIALPRYVSILDQHMTSIKTWTRSTMRAIHNLLTTLIYAEGCYGPYVNGQAFRSLIDHLLRLLDTPSLRQKIRSKASAIETLLIDATLMIFAVVIYEPEALDYIRQRKPIAVFHQLTSAPSEAIVLNACVLLAYTLEEQDIKASPTDYSQLLATILDRLQKTTKALQQINATDYINQENLTRNVMQLIETLKGLAQFEQIRNELFKLKAVPSLIKSYEDSHGLSKELLLDCLWTLAFNENIADELRRHPQLISSLEQISTTAVNPQKNLNGHQNLASINSNAASGNGLKRAANGLLWKLVQEISFRSKLKPPTDFTLRSGNEQYQYDVMISSCYADRKVVSKIEQYLINKGFRVRLDRDSFQERVMKTVAEAIEHSACVLVCISGSFKRDNHCQAEVQYAFYRKRPLLPVIVRKGSKPDGWLSSIVDKNACIDVAISDPKSVLALLANEISQLQKSRPSKADAGSANPPTKNRDVSVANRAPTTAAPSSGVVYSVVSVSSSTNKKPAEPTRTTSGSTPSGTKPTSSVSPTRHQETRAPVTQRTTDRSQPQAITSKIDSPLRFVPMDREPQEAPARPPPRISTERPIPTQQQMQATATPLRSRSVTPTIDRSAFHPLSDRQESFSIGSGTSFNSLELTMTIAQRRQEKQFIQSRSMTSIASQISTGTPLDARSTVSRADSFVPSTLADRRSSASSENSLASTLAMAGPRQEEEAVQSRLAIPTGSHTATDASIVIEQKEQPAPSTDVVRLVPSENETPTEAKHSIFRSRTTSSVTSDSSLSANEAPEALSVKLTAGNLSNRHTINQAATTSTISTVQQVTVSAPNVVAQQHLPIEASRVTTSNIAPMAAAATQTVIRAEQTQDPIPVATAALIVQQERSDQSSRTSPSDSVLNANQAKERHEVTERSMFRSSASNSTSESSNEDSSSPDESICTDTSHPSVQTSAVQRTAIPYGPFAPPVVPYTQEAPSPIPVGTRPVVLVPRPPKKFVTAQQRPRPPVIVPRPPPKRIAAQQRIEPQQQQQWQTPIYQEPDVRPAVTIAQRPPQAALIPDSTVQYASVEQQQLQVPPQQVPRLSANSGIIPERSQQPVMQQPSAASTVPDSRQELAPIQSPASSKLSSISAFIEKQKQKASRELDSRSTVSSASSDQSVVSSDSSTAILIEVPNPVPLPEEFTHRVISNSLYRSLPVNAWTKKDILDYLFDLKLYAMMPLCELMSGQAFIRLFRMCQEKPTRLFSQLNEELRSRFNGLTLPIGVYTEFLTEMNGLVGPTVGALPTVLSMQPTHGDRVAVMVSSIQHQPASADGQSPGFTAEFTHHPSASSEQSERQANP